MAKRPPAHIDNNSNPLLDAALVYASKGTKVFPCLAHFEKDKRSGKAGKAPKVKWKEEASLNPDKIIEWWTVWPNANIGIPTGKDNNLFVIDVDSEDGRTYLKEHMEIPITPVSKTGRGWQLFFEAPALDMKNWVKVLPDIDIRTEGGYVIAPPSIHENGATYEWLKGQKLGRISLARLPWSFVELIRDPRAKKKNDEEEENNTEIEVIPEGQRDSMLTTLAGYFRLARLPEGTILHCLEAVNEDLCEPPIETGEVEKIAQSIGQKAPGKVKIDDPKDTLLALKIETWKDKNTGNGFVTFMDRGKLEHYPAFHSAFAAVIREQYRAVTGKELQKDKTTQTQQYYEDQAKRHSEKWQLHVRTEHYGRDAFDPLAANGCFHVDLCNDEREAVKIYPGGWEIVKNTPLKFFRESSADTLPRPEGEVPIDALWDFVRLPDDTSRILFLTFLFGCFTPTGDYPILSLAGEQGSGKSHIANVLHLLIDPHGAKLTKEPKPGGRDLATVANGHRLISYDNLSYITQELSNDLCRLSTGGSITMSAMYTLDEEKIWNLYRPLILTGIGDILTKGDALSRAITLVPEAVPDTIVGDYKAIRIAFMEKRPGLLWTIYSVLGSALESLPTCDLPWVPRWSEAAMLAYCCLQVLGHSSTQILDAWGELKARTMEAVLDSNLMARHILEYIKRNKSYEGPKGRLLDIIKRAAEGSPDYLAVQKYTPRGFGHALRDARSALAQQGVVYADLGRKSGLQNISLVFTGKGLENETPGGADKVLFDDSPF